MASRASERRGHGEPMTATANMPLLERLRKGANCVVFLDGAPEPAADVADMLRKAADKIEQQQAALVAVQKDEKEFRCSSAKTLDMVDAALSHG